MSSSTSPFPQRRKISLVRHLPSKPSQTLPDQPIQDNTQIEADIHHSKLLFKNLLKEYERVLLQFPLSHNNISITTLDNILTTMHYIIKHRSADTEESLESLFDILKSPYFGVTLTNLFKFMLVIENIHYLDEWLGATKGDILEADEREKPIGVFNRDGDWFLESHERLGVRKLFQNMYYNRLSSIRMKTVDDSYQDCRFSPEILNRSRVLAEKQRTKIRSFSKKNLLASSSHEQLLIVSKKIREENIKHSAEKLDKEEKSKCPFKPKINIRKKSVDQPKDRCLYLYNKSKQSLSPTHKPSLQQKQNRSLKQCTFHPSSTSSSKMKLSCMPLAKNSHSSIQRMKKGEHMRKMSRTFHQRGYPQNVTNWTKFFHNYKKNLEYDPNKVGGQNSSIISKDPIMTIKVDFGGKEESIDMFEGDSIENLACKILVRNSLPSYHLKSVEDMLCSEIQGHKRVSVNNGFVYQFA